MDYVQPYGNADPNAPYVDRNSPGAVKGSTVPAAAIEAPMREIRAVIVGAGITPDRNDLTQLNQAIAALIAQATGGGPEEGYVTFDVARARLPIFPEVLTADGRLPIVSPSSGQVRVPAGYDFVHRGIFVITTAQVDFATAANKTYHVRWTPGGGFALKDLADAGYNAGGSPTTEANEVLDSTYDDILFARVVTNGANVPTVKNLANKARLELRAMVTGTDIQLASDNGANVVMEHIYDWARRPKVVDLVKARLSYNHTIADADHDFNIFAPGPSRTDAVAMTAASPAIPVDRYRLNAVVMYDMMQSLTMHFSAGA